MGKGKQWRPFVSLLVCSFVGFLPKTEDVFIKVKKNKRKMRILPRKYKTLLKYD